MPHTIPLVSELEWKATSKDGVIIKNSAFTFNYVRDRSADGPWFHMDGGISWFTEACRQKLLAAMDSYGKVEEAEHWKQISSIANEPSSPYAKAILELLQRIEALEGKK